ncbi:MAG TPA: PQQ-binding-like beta-propeller repeat protein [Mycobacteriales bacterium]|jgi:outer membrane protein assembly factor BamB|nr:PQQ-binding-like beta-propeller repeat protein [Mycobacteriales bacterium]
MSRRRLVLPAALVALAAALAVPGRAASPAGGSAPVRCGPTRSGLVHALHGWCGEHALHAALLPVHHSTAAPPPEQGCPVDADPTARCAEVLGSGSDFRNNGAVAVAAGHFLTFGGAKGLTVIGYDVRTSRRAFARTYPVAQAPALWTAEAGGSSGVVVAAGHLGDDASDSYGSYVAAFDARDGRMLWSKAGPVKGHRDEAMVTADGRLAYVARWVWEGGGKSTYAEDWTVEAYELRTGRLVWRHDELRHDALDQCPLALAVSGDRLVVVGYEEPRPGGSYAMDTRVDVMTTSGRVLSRTTHDYHGSDDELYAVAISPDGRTAGATGFATRQDEPYAYDDPVTAVDLRTGTQRWWAVDAGNGVGAEAYLAAWAHGALLVGQDAWLQPTNLVNPGSVGGLYQWASTPRVVAYDGATGALRWRTALPSASSRIGAVYAMALRADGDVVYVGGVEGTGDGVAIAAVPGAFVYQPLLVSDAFVRAVSTADGTELWTGRDPSDLSRPGSTSEVYGLAPYGKDVLTAGEGLVAVQNGTQRTGWTIGRLLRFRGD